MTFPVRPSDSRDLMGSSCLSASIPTPLRIELDEEHAPDQLLSYRLRSCSPFRGTIMLTRKQRELLNLIRDRLREEGVAPSFDEMREALGLRSKSGVHRLITALTERGFIRLLPRRARTLEVVRLPDSDQTPGSFFTGRHRGRLQSGTERPAGWPGRRNGQRAAVWPHRGGYAGRRLCRSFDAGRGTGRSRWRGRSLRVGSRRRFDGRGRHP